MEKPKIAFDQQMQVRTATIPRRCLGDVVVAVQASGVKFNGKRPTQEAVINASWLYLNSLEESELRKVMTGALAALEESFGAEAPPAGLVKGQAIKPQKRDKRIG